MKQLWLSLLLSPAPNVQDRLPPVELNVKPGLAASPSGIIFMDIEIDFLT